MKRLAIATAAVALALLTFFQFPRHTWLEQDTQIYVPILEHLRDASVLRNDQLAAHPHVRFTLYDETALLLRAVGLDFRIALELGQVLTRALGIWGLFLCGTAILRRPGGSGGGPAAGAFLVAAICSLGVQITGPQVLTMEYEPTPRAFAIPLLICGIGLAAHRRYLAAGVAGACAFLYHPPTALPFCAVYLAIALWPGKRETLRLRARGLLPLAGAVAILAAAAALQTGDGEAQSFFARLTPAQEQLQRMRAPYVWISIWWRTALAHYLIVFGIGMAAYWRIRREMPFELRAFLAGLPVLGMLSMPVSWILLEHWKWTLVPQLQPLRTLLFVALAAQFLTAAAGVRAGWDRRFFESAAWFAAAYLLPVQPLFTTAVPWGRVASVAGMALLTAVAVHVSQFPRLRFAPAAAGLAAFFLLPAFAGIPAAQRAATPELAEVSGWARGSTRKDAVFLFPDAGRAGYPGVFRSEALRAVYVDWKGGGQVNFLKGLGEEWWSRWQRTGAGKYKPRQVAWYAAMGVDYIVLQSGHSLNGVAPAFENARFAAYRVR
jgi:hypothetical protein